VAQHYFAYVVLEEAADAMRNDPVGGAFVFDSLRRLPALEEDLEFLIGSDWKSKIAPNEATVEYCARMKEVCFDWAGGFVAHGYTRYLGDLSGGQVIKAAVERAFDIKDGKGVQFYVFDQIPDYKAFKINYRDLLDGASWAEGEQQKVIDEAILAYRMNTKVLAEIGRDLPRYLKN
jgi:heme oxygenase